MRFFGFDIYRDFFCIESRTGETDWLIPFPNIRRYEEMGVTSTKDEYGNIVHKPKIKYRFRFHNDPVSVGLSRKKEIRDLISLNEEKLGKGESKVKSSELLFSRY